MPPKFTLGELLILWIFYFHKVYIQLLNTFIHTSFWFKSMFDAGKALMWVKKIADFWRFWYLNIPCLRRNITYSSCDFLKRSNKFTHMTDCFYWFLVAMFVPLKGIPNIYKTLFFPNFLHIKFCPDVILGNAFCVFIFFHFPHSGLSL